MAESADTQLNGPSVVEDKPIRYVINDKGEVKDKASPEHLPLVLRNMPSDLVTKDIEDEHKIHAEDLDTPHIVGALADERAKLELGVKPLDPLAEPEKPEVPDDADVALTQEWVDVRRLRVMREWVNTQKARMLGGADKQPAYLGVIHLWFDDNDHRSYCMRFGNPPADRDRPKHLCGLRLEIDIMSGALPSTVIDRMRAKGVSVTSVYEDMTRKELNMNRVLDANGDTWQ